MMANIIIGNDGAFVVRMRGLCYILAIIESYIAAATRNRIVPFISLFCLVNITKKYYVYTYNVQTDSRLIFDKFFCWAVLADCYVDRLIACLANIC